MDAQADAQRRFNSQGFLVLSDVPRGSEFGLDGQVWIVNELSGVKFVPEGFHLFLVSAAPPPPPSTSSTSTGPASTSDSSTNPSGGSTSSATEEETTNRSGGLGVRYAALKWFGDQETVVLEWDTKHERFKSTAGDDDDETKTLRRTMRKGKEKAPSQDDVGEGTIVSSEYLKTLDRTLAPYPAPTSDHALAWKALTGYVTRETIARVVGVDSRGIARVDALVEGWRENDQLKRAEGTIGGKGSGDREGEVVGQGKTFWGKKRPADEAETHEVVELDQDDGRTKGQGATTFEGLEFVKFDDKRSWPTGAVGPDLTRWSKDKSWQLSDVVATQLDGDAKELLAEFQLSFVLFTLVYNFSALSTYKSLFALVCGSSILCRPTSSRPQEALSTLPTPLLESETSLPLVASFVQVVAAQLSFLDPTFFSTQLPSLETDLLSSLSDLRRSLSDAASAWYGLASDSPAREIWSTVVSRWNGLSASTMEKFGWDLGMIEGSKARYGELRDEMTDRGEVPFEDLEEGEDAPVIVDLEGDDDDDRPILVGF
ncbi:hypothetical protein JCM10212_005215 [Sporobolomyces blumeae]